MTTLMIPQVISALPPSARALEVAGQIQAGLPDYHLNDRTAWGQTFPVR
jgi:hypothetical protein